MLKGSSSGQTLPGKWKVVYPFSRTFWKILLGFGWIVPTDYGVNLAESCRLCLVGCMSSLRSHCEPYRPEFHLRWFFPAGREILFQIRKFLAKSFYSKEFRRNSPQGFPWCDRKKEHVGSGRGTPLDFLFKEAIEVHLFFKPGLAFSKRPL